MRQSHSGGLRIRIAAIAVSSIAALAGVLAPSAAHAAVEVGNDDYSLSAGEPFTTPQGQGLFANDIGIPTSLGIRNTLPAHGDLMLETSGAFTYVPDPGFVGVDTFTYCVTLTTSTNCVSAWGAVRLHVEAVVERIGGADRYAVSAGVSAAKFGPGVSAVYVASGEVFPDALSASAAAGTVGSPVLLVPKAAIPDVIDVELTRLKPQRIIVIGGTNTISATVERALQAYVMPGAVERIAGADRYAVSAGISSATFTAGVPGAVAYIASGELFPDALSGSAVAGRRGGPVLLVSRDAVPSVVSDELARLAPTKIVILGGTNSVSAAVESELQIKAITTRIAGPDRFAVSAAVSAASFTPSDTHFVYVASGGVFADALSGSAAAVKGKAAVLLVTKDVVPEVVAVELDRLKPTRIVVLGGPNTISDVTLAALQTHLAH